MLGILPAPPGLPDLVRPDEDRQQPAEPNKLLGDHLHCLAVFDERRSGGDDALADAYSIKHGNRIAQGFAQFDPPLTGDLFAALLFHHIDGVIVGRSIATIPGAGSHDRCQRHDQDLAWPLCLSQHQRSDEAGPE